MFCRKTLYHKIEKIRHSTLKVIYQSEESYENLLLESSSVSVHQRLHLRFFSNRNLQKYNANKSWIYVALFYL